MTRGLSIRDMSQQEKLGTRRYLVAASKRTNNIGRRKVYLHGIVKQTISGALTGSK